MALYHLTNDSIKQVEQTGFEQEVLKERQDLQRLLKDNISALGDDLLVISEEYNEFLDSKRSIDLLAVDKDANLVVIELKRTTDGGHMELQAIRYAAMISNMTWDNAVNAYSKFLSDGSEAEEKLLEFLEWDEPLKDEFGANIRIILASADFSKEITTSVLWLNSLELDITCVRLKLYKLGGELILSAEQIIPLPETESYQIELREKRRDVRDSKQSNKDRSTYTLRINDDEFATGFKKSDIGFNTVRAIDQNGLLNQAAFEFLRDDRTCNFQLLKKADEITGNEKKYGKYRYKRDPELTYEGVGYYIARNWGVGIIDEFISKITNRFPHITIAKEQN